MHLHHDIEPALKTTRTLRAVARSGCVSVVAESVDELTLVHPGASLDADLPGALLQVLLGPVLVAPRLPAAPSRRRARGVGDPRRLLLALPLLSQPLVLLVILDGWSVISSHSTLSPCLWASSV